MTKLTSRRNKEGSSAPAGSPEATTQPPSITPERARILFRQYDAFVERAGLGPFLPGADSVRGAAPRRAVMRKP